MNKMERVNVGCAIGIGAIMLSLPLSLSLAPATATVSPSHGPSSPSVYDDELPDITADPSPRVDTTPTAVPTVAVSPSAIPLEVIVNDPSPSPDAYDPDEGETVPVEEAAMIYDPDNATYTIYPDSLPPCDEEDGTSSSGGVDVSACMWDNATHNNSGRNFIVIHP